MLFISELRPFILQGHFAWCKMLKARRRGQTSSKYVDICKNKVERKRTPRFLVQTRDLSNPVPKYSCMGYRVTYSFGTGQIRVWYGFGKLKPGFTEQLRGI